jgi:dTDP-glucose 4,6-dehydratase
MDAQPRSTKHYSSMRAANLLPEDIEHILLHTAEVWEELRGKSVFVTGGTGFFGRWLLESFAEANQRLELGARMVVLSRDPAACASHAPHLGREAGIEFVRGDVRTFTTAEVSSQLPSHRLQCDFVVHAATESNSSLNIENPELMLSTVVEGTRSALRFAAEAGARRFLFTSSGAVYGQQPATLSHIPEEHPSGPDLSTPASAYSEGKRAAEVLCACYQRKGQLEPIVARCFAFFGPYLPLGTHQASASFMRDALNGGPIRVSGSGAGVRSYLYAADLTIWLWRLLIGGCSGRAYNVGSEQSVTIAEWAGEIRDALAPLSQVEIAGIAGGGDASRYVPATRRARDELQLEQWITRADGLRRFAQWQRGQEPLSRGRL